MRPPIFGRPLTDAERPALAAGLRSADAFVLRRGQILLASARGERAPRIAEALGCDDQTVLDAVHAFNARGLDALQRGSSRPHQPPPQAFPGERSTSGQHRQQMGARLEAWLVAAAASQIAELVSFANGILRDFEAVVAALVWDYSQGQTEGQVNRLNSSCSSAVALAVRSSISCASRCCIAAHSAGGGQREAAVFIKYAGVPILLRRL